MKDLSRSEKIMRCFSAQRNMKKLFADNKYDREDEELEMINAVKVIGISVIIFGNTYYYIMSGPLQNLDIVYEWTSSPFFMFVIWADLHVDVFYWVTGFLLSF